MPVTRRRDDFPQSDIPGVVWYDKSSKWRVSFTVDGHKCHFGYYDKRVDAEIAALGVWATLEEETGEHLHHKPRPCEAESCEWLPLRNTRGFIIDWCAVDRDIFPQLNQNGWSLTNAYPSTNVDGKTTYLHHIVLSLLGVEIPHGYEVDHINGDKLNATSENLRVVTGSVNGQNRTLESDSRSGHRGVHWCSQSQKYFVRVYNGEKFVNGGRMFSEDELDDAKDVAKGIIESLPGWRDNVGRSL